MTLYISLCHTLRKLLKNRRKCFTGRVHFLIAVADLDANCTYNANCTEGDEGNNEICGTGDTPVCICDLDNDFVRSTVNTELCLKSKYYSIIRFSHTSVYIVRSMFSLLSF